MSVETVTERVAQLQALINGTPPAQTAADPNAFSTQLAAATTGPTATAATAPVGGADGSTYDAMINAAATRNGVDPALLKGLIRQESNFNPNAGSPAGAQGLTQLMPGTAASLGVTNPFDPAQSIEGGARYLKAQLDRFGGDEAKALAAYNAGPGAVQRFGGVPPYAETQNYVQRVLAYAAQYRAASAPATTTSLTTPAVPAATGALPYSTT